MRFSAAARSGALSASVPSKSNSTALLTTHATQEVIDVAVRFQLVALGERVVSHADQLLDAQPRRSRPARQLRGLDEALVVMRAARQQAQEILGADHGEEVGLRI